MTEAEWLSCSDPDRMLSSLASRGEPDERRLRLVACACVRQGWRLLTRPARVLVKVSEAYAQGAATAAHLARAQGPLEGLGGDHIHPSPRFFAIWAAWFAGRREVGLVRDCLRSVRRALARRGGSRKVKRAQAEILRDLFGPRPFRTVAFDPWWRTRDVLAIAHAIHAHRAFEDLPALGDALEEAGCDCEELLDHLRGGGPHYLGCWGLDLVMGRR